MPGHRDGDPTGPASAAPAFVATTHRAVVSPDSPSQLALPASAVPESVPRFATGDHAPDPQRPQQPQPPQQQPKQVQQPAQLPPVPAVPGLTPAQESPAGALTSSGAVGSDASKQLLWRARKGAKPIVALWLTATATGCDLSSDVYPVKSLRVDPVQAGPYRFQNADDAHAFAQEAARALMHLGCEVAAGERRPGAEDPPASPSS